ncbi:tripartite tricarboxylate transporter substrate binding protein [Clostridiales bacterium]
MKKAKKVLAMALVLTMTLSLVACGSNPAASTSVASSDPAVSSAPVEESTYPNDTISFIIPYAAGDGLDTSTRALLENAEFPVNTLVENISGGSGTIGLQDAFGREADGYTVAILSNGPTIAQPLLNDTLTYTLEDWEVLTFTTAPVLAVLGCSASKGIENSDDMKAFLESGEPFTVGVPSMSGFGYVAAASMFNQMGIMDKVTWVSYDGAPALYQAYLSGEIDFATFDDNFAAQYANSGNSVTVGVVMNDIRSQYFPDVAAAGEWGVEGLGANIGFKAAAVKKGTPAYVCEYLTKKINAAVVTEGYQKWCEDNYFGVLTEEDIYTGEEAMEMLIQLRETNRTVLTAAGLLG